MTGARGGFASTSYSTPSQGLQLHAAPQIPFRMSARTRSVASRAAATALQFSKFHGLGNDFLLVLACR